MGAEQVAVAGGPPPPRQGEARPGPPETVGRRDREPTTEWRLTMRNIFKGLWQDESGAASAEYALILATVAFGIAVAVTDRAPQIGHAIDADGTALHAGTARPSNTFPHLA